MALRANEEGYALIDTFEIDGRPVRDDSTLQALEELAERLEASALLVSGVVDRQRVDGIADRTRMVIREVRL
jgi:hypothetical protein